MAAAAIPLIAAAVTTLGPEIISLLASLTHKAAPVAEAAHGPGTGPVKFADLFVSVMGDMARAHAQGQIAVLPDDATAKLVIQSVLSSLKILGLLDGPAAPVPTPIASQSVSLKAGQSITISVL